MTLSIALRHAFPGFSLDAAFSAPPGVTALFGRSGSGKSTVVNAVAGLLRPDAGRVTVDGSVLLDTERGTWMPPHRRRIGYVFQDGRLFPHLTVRQNLLYGRWFATDRPVPAEIARVVQLLGIGPLLRRRPVALSGGEKQRVAIGRALLCAPRLLLMDEPLAALDEARRAEILPYLERVRDEAKVPILYVSHSVAEVARLATTVVALDAGRVVRAGPTTEVLSEPVALPGMAVREAGAVLTARVTAQHDDGLTEVALSAARLLLPRIGAPPGTRLRLRVEAQDVVLALDPPGRISALNVIPAEVTALHAGEGPGMLVQLQTGEDRFLARITQRSAARLSLATGTRCYAIVKSVSVAPEDVGRV